MKIFMIVVMIMSFIEWYYDKCNPNLLKHINIQTQLTLLINKIFIKKLGK